MDNHTPPTVLTDTWIRSDSLETTKRKVRETSLTTRVKRYIHNLSISWLFTRSGLHYSVDTLNQYTPSSRSFIDHHELRQLVLFAKLPIGVCGEISVYTAQFTYLCGKIINQKKLSDLEKEFLGVFENLPLLVNILNQFQKDTSLIKKLQDIYHKQQNEINSIEFILLTQAHQSLHSTVEIDKEALVSKISRIDFYEEIMMLIKNSLEKVTRYVMYYSDSIDPHTHQSNVYELIYLISKLISDNTDRSPTSILDILRQQIMNLMKRGNDSYFGKYGLFWRMSWQSLPNRKLRAFKHLWRKTLYESLRLIDDTQKIKYLQKLIDEWRKVIPMTAAIHTYQDTDTHLHRRRLPHRINLIWYDNTQKVFYAANSSYPTHHSHLPKGSNISIPYNFFLRNERWWAKILWVPYGKIYMIVAWKPPIQ